VVVSRQQIKEAWLLRAVTDAAGDGHGPASGCTTPAQIRISVLLPAPFSPMIATDSPAGPRAKRRRGSRGRRSSCGRRGPERERLALAVEARVFEFWHGEAH